MPEDMMTKKPWFASKTLWLNAVMVVAAISGAFGMDLGLDPATQTAIVVGIMGVVGIILRFMTDKAISSGS